MRAIQEPGGAATDRTFVRDAALVRISRTRRWTLAGAAALTAGLAALASALLPGKSFGAKSHSTPQTTSRPATVSSSVAPPLPAPASPAQLGVGGATSSSPPPQPTAPPAPAVSPQPAQSAPPVVSGGS